MKIVKRNKARTHNIVYKTFGSQCVIEAFQPVSKVLVT